MHHGRHSGHFSSPLSSGRRLSFWCRCGRPINLKKEKRNYTNIHEVRFSNPIHFRSNGLSFHDAALDELVVGAASIHSMSPVEPFLSAGPSESFRLHKNVDHYLLLSHLPCRAAEKLPINQCILHSRYIYSAPFATLIEFTSSFADGKPQRHHFLILPPAESVPAE